MMSRKFVTSCAVREFLSLHSLVTLLPKLRRKSRELSFPVAVKTRRIVLSSKTDGLLVIQNDTPLLVEHFDGQFGHAYHPRGGVRLLSEEITHLLPFITAVLLCNADTIGLECLQSRRKLRLRHVVRGPTRPHGIISFFAGSGSFANTLAEELGPPCAMLIAELDSSIRTVISAVQGYHLDPAIWTYANHRIPVRYLADVWEIVHHHFAALRELPARAHYIWCGLAMSGQHQDWKGGWSNLALQALEVFTTTLSTLSCMRSRKWVWLIGLFLCLKMQAVWPTASNNISRTRVGCLRRAYIASILPNGQQYLGIVTFLSVTPPISCPRGKPTLGNKDGCCLNLVSPPMPPWLRTRGITPGGHIRFTTSAYHPRHLLYKVDYFGTVADFHEKCGEQPWADFLPATAVRALQQIIQWGAPIAQLPNKEQEAAAVLRQSEPKLPLSTPIPRRKGC